VLYAIPDYLLVQGQNAAVQEFTVINARRMVVSMN
jgi:hypothetical protein